MDAEKRRILLNISEILAERGFITEEEKRKIRNSVNDYGDKDIPDENR